MAVAHISGTFEFDVTYHDPQDGRPMIDHLNQEAIRQMVYDKFFEPTHEVWWKATVVD